MTRNEFIEKIAGYVQKYASSYGIKVHSPIIAQAILESGWGESRLAAVYHNYFGLKCGTLWTGKSVNMTTQEEYNPGTLTTIKDNFRVYDSMEDGVKGYFEFIQLARYKNLKGITDPADYLFTIKADGYATSSNYVVNNMKVIEQYDLTKYDYDIEKDDVEMSKVMVKQIIDDAVDFAVNIANDNSHGYSQKVRSLYEIDVPKSFDCSSLVLTAFYYAFMKNGLKNQANYLKRNCSYTGNMLKMLNCGFEVVARNQTAHAKMLKGDVELNETHHTALAIDPDNIVHARTSEGTSDTKDGSGNEIRTQKWYLYSHGWTHRLRFTGKGLNLSNTSTNTSNASPKKSVDVIAKEVLAGKWGNGEERESRLKSAGYDYDEIQKKVNQLAKGASEKKSVAEVAKDVIAGKYGTGKARIEALTKEGYDFEEVQEKVNEILGVKKTVTEIAQEVLEGKWGNGADRKKKLEAAGYDYDAVQKKVNALLK